MPEPFAIGLDLGGTDLKAGDQVTIAFTVDRPTDVAVAIEDGQGKVIRHLAAGVLGKNPPEPLQLR